MSRLNEIEAAIAELPPEELKRFREWYARFDADAWNEQIAADVDAGKLGALAEQALRRQANRQTRPLWTTTRPRSSRKCTTDSPPKSAG